MSLRLVVPVALSVLLNSAAAAEQGGADPQVQPADPEPAALRDPPFTVLYWPGGQAFAQRVLDLSQANIRLPALPPEILEGDAEIRIYVAPDPAVFDSLTGGRAPEWAAGVAIPARSMIVLPAYGPGAGRTAELARVVRHELAHIALHRYLEPSPIPRWFDEGYARWASGFWDFEAAWQLRLAFALRRAPPLDSLTLSWPRAATDARVAYLLAASAVAFLVEGGGERGLALFLERWREQGRMEAAFRQTYGMTTSQFEVHWRRAVRSRYGWTFFLSHSLVFWTVLVALLFLLFRRRRQRDRDRLERLRATEPPDSPAYWLDTEPPPETPLPPSDDRDG